MCGQDTESVHLNMMIHVFEAKGTSSSSKLDELHFDIRSEIVDL